MKTTTNVQSGYLCHCLRITVEDFEKMIAENPGADFAKLKEKTGIGSKCSSCEYEAKGLILEAPLTHHAAEQRPSLVARVEQAVANGRRALHDLVTGRKTGHYNYYSGIFFMRRHGMESRLAVSNLTFPERAKNPNGRRVSLKARLYGDNGELLAESKQIVIPANGSRELTIAEMFPGFTAEFTGSLYVDFPLLAQTGSLRPYGILTATDGGEARCHYHDKFGYFKEPGYVHSTSPFEPGQTTWFAVANCQNLPYKTEAFLKVGGKKLSVPFELPPMGSCWVKLEDLFGKDNLPEDRSPALFWLESNQHVMAYFFWHNESANTWTGQHH